MASRHADWLKQGQRDLAHGRRSLDAGDYEWACFAAQQGAEKAVKAVVSRMGRADLMWGHSVADVLEVLFESLMVIHTWSIQNSVPKATALLEVLSESLWPDPRLLDAAKALDKHYIPARYPNSYLQGAPYEYYTRTEAESALVHAGQIINFCEGILAEPLADSSASQARSSSNA